MPHLVVDAVAKRDNRHPLVRLFLSISDDSTPVNDVTPQDIHIEPVEPAAPLQVAAIYPEAYLPGRYVAVIESSHHDVADPGGRRLFRVKVDRPGAQEAQTLVYLAPQDED